MSKRRKPARRAATRTKRAPSPKNARQRIPPPGQGRWFSVPYAGLLGARSCHVYVPKGLRRTTRAPLLLALHGCGQTALEFARATRFCELADRHQFVVVYPEQALTVNGQRCWNWHQPGNQFPLRGEPGILAAIVQRTIADRSRWRIDPERVYVAGLSAGGAMATTLGVTYPDLFAAVGVHSGPPYRSATTTGQVLSAMQGRRLPPAPSNLTTRLLPPTIIIQGTRDGTVWPVNAQRIADHWLATYRYVSEQAEKPLPVPRLRAVQQRAGTPVTTGSRRASTVQRWTAGGERVLEVWLVDGLAHAWSGGKSGLAYSDRRGPRASTEMWRFFSAHRRRQPSR